MVAIGGGHGLSATLRAVRMYAGELTAIVSVADDGGSSGRLRRQFAIPAPGDLRRCLVALAEEGSPWASAFEYRFGPESGSDLEGHALGNLVIAGLAGATGDFATALRLAAELLGADARILPATAGPVDLAGDVDGVEVVGQVRIQDAEGEVHNLHIRTPAMARESGAPDGVRSAIAGADQVVIGPGSLFTSVLAACVVPDVREALAAREGGRVYVCNLRPEIPETDGFSPGDHVRALAEHGVAVDTVVVDPGWWRGRRVDAEIPKGATGPDVRERTLTADPDPGPDSDADHDPGLLAAALLEAL